jgi:hypothetical protein
LRGFLVESTSFFQTIAFFGSAIPALLARNRPGLFGSNRTPSQDRFSNNKEVSFIQHSAFLFFARLRFGPAVVLEPLYYFPSVKVGLVAPL